MKRLLGVALFFGLGLAVFGCNSFPPWRDRGPVVDNGNSKVAFTKREPEAVDLVAFMNDNAKRVQGVQAVKVTMDCKQGNEVPIGLDAMIACQKPRQFRLKGTIGGKQVVDIGSNDEEFWYWISENKPVPYLFHCSYKDMAGGQVRLPFPFNPDMVVCALNIGDYKPVTEVHYDVRKNKDIIELIEATKSLQGQDIYKVTVFNRGDVTATRPRVLGYALRDKQTNKDICTASILDTQVNKQTGAVLPTRVQIVFHGKDASERSEMKMQFYDLQPRTFDRDRSTALFSRGELSHLQGYDLARGPDRASGMGMSIQRTNMNTVDR